MKVFGRSLPIRADPENTKMTRPENGNGGESTVQRSEVSRGGLTLPNYKPGAFQLRQGAPN